MTRTLFLAAVSLVCVLGVSAQQHNSDTQKSTLTMHVGKTRAFSGLTRNSAPSPGALSDAVIGKVVIGTTRTLPPLSLRCKIKADLVAISIPASTIRILCEIRHHGKKILRLTHKQSHVRQELNHAHGNGLGFSRSDNRTHG
jgi:hypothetical protein